MKIFCSVVHVCTLPVALLECVCGGGGGGGYQFWGDGPIISWQLWSSLGDLYCGRACKQSLLPLTTAAILRRMQGVCRLLSLFLPPCSWSWMSATCWLTTFSARFWISTRFVTLLASSSSKTVCLDKDACVCVRRYVRKFVYMRQILVPYFRKFCVQK